jgi:hypothetical protein
VLFGAGAGSVFTTPANGAGKLASAGRIARASSLGSAAPAEALASMVMAAVAASSRFMART